MKNLSHTDATLERLTADGRIRSYALVVGYGADEWTRTSEDVNLDTCFDAASLGKVFPTSTLILKAVDEGKLSLTDTIDRFFPNTPDDKRQITIRHLLTHTSGMLRREFPDDVAVRGRESIAEFILNTPLSYPTGTKYAYCCTGYILLGFILERVFGMPLDEAFARLLCQPLGLARSGYNLPPDAPNAVNCNHDLNITDIRRDDNLVKRMRGIPAGSGGNYCTAADLQKFVRAIIRRDKRLYSRAMFDLSEQNCTEGLEVLDPQRGIENHALGFVYVNRYCEQARDLFPDGSLGHTGWTGQSFYLNRDRNLYVILLTDAMRCTVRKYGKTIDDCVHGIRIEVHRAIARDLEIRSPYCENT